VGVDVEEAGEGKEVVGVEDKQVGGLEEDAKDGKEEKKEQDRQEKGTEEGGVEEELGSEEEVHTSSKVQTSSKRARLVTNFFSSEQGKAHEKEEAMRQQVARLYVCMIIHVIHINEGIMNTEQINELQVVHLYVKTKEGSLRQRVVCLYVCMIIHKWMDNEYRIDQ